MIADRQGNVLSGATVEASVLFNQAVDAFNIYRGDPVGLLDQAIEVAPNFAMAHIVKAHLLGLATEPDATRDAKAILDTAKSLRLSDREASHVAALDLLVEGEAILGSGGWSRSRPRYAVSAAATETTAPKPTVRSVFVDPAATRRGIASAIMLRTEQDALEHGVETLHLTATLSGFALYEVSGYQTDEATALTFPDQSRFECVRMSKSLKTPGIRAA